MRPDARFHKKPCANRLKTQAAQATVEMTLALVIGLLFSVASFKVWVWLTQAIVEENRCYQKTRREAAIARGTYWNPGLGRQAVATYDAPGAVQAFNQAVIAILDDISAWVSASAPR